MNRLFFLFFPLSIFSFAFARDTSIAEENFKWNKNQISVCWAGEKISDLNLTTLITENLQKKYKSDQFILPDLYLKKLIQDTVSVEFTPDETGIYFTDWENCHGDDWDLMILVGKTSSPGTNGFALLGQGALITESLINMRPIDLDQRKSYVFFDKDFIKKSSNYVKKTILHEFGHVAGLRHEHDRKEAKKDPICRELYITTTEIAFPGTTFYGDYDPSSIMNYCFLNFKRDADSFMAKNKLNALESLDAKNLGQIKLSMVNHLRPGRNVTRESISDNEVLFKLLPKLSEGDRHTLKCLYIYEGLDYEKNCNSGK